MLARCSYVRDIQNVNTDYIVSECALCAYWCNAFKHLLYIHFSCSIIHSFLSIYLPFLLFGRLHLFVCLFFCNIWTVQKKNSCLNKLTEVNYIRARKTRTNGFRLLPTNCLSGFDSFVGLVFEGWGFPYDIHLKNFNIKTLTAFENWVREIA